jgi:hypothetical protein
VWILPKAQSQVAVFGPEKSCTRSSTLRLAEVPLPGFSCQRCGKWHTRTKTLHLLGGRNFYSFSDSTGWRAGPLVVALGIPAPSLPALLVPKALSFLGPWLGVPRFGAQRGSPRRYSGRDTGFWSPPKGPGAC